MGEREYIAEKRSGIRRRQTGPEKKDKNLITGAIIITIVFVLIFSAYSATEKISDVPEKAVAQELAQEPASTTGPGVEVQAEPGATPLSTPEPEEKPARDIPAPEITIRSPENATINESTPLLDVYVEGEEIDTVWVSVDDGPNVTISHSNGTINYVRLNPLFADDFSGNVSEWTSLRGSWSIEDGTYVGERGDIGIEIKPSIQSVYEVKAMFKSSLGIKNPYIALYLFEDGNNQMIFRIYHIDSSYAPSGGYIGQREEGIWTYYETSAPIKIDYDQWYKLKIYFEDERMGVSINDISWLSYALQNPSKEYEDLRLGYDSRAYFDDLTNYKPLQDRQHYITIYVNNTVGNLSQTTRYFAINTTTPEIKTPTISDTVTKGSLAVTLNQYLPIEDIIYPSASTGKYAMAHITVENVGKVEKDVKLDTKTILLDELGDQYIFKNLKRTDEILQGTLYPGGKKSGTLYFTPAMSLKAKNVKLIVNVDGEKYEFELKAF